MVPSFAGLSARNVKGTGMFKKLSEQQAEALRRFHLRTEVEVVKPLPVVRQGSRTTPPPPAGK